MKILSFISCLFLIVAAASGVRAATPASSSLFGYWHTEERDGVVELYPCEDRLCGRFHWLKKDSPENPSVDDKNPDPDKRRRPLCGMQFMGGFTSDGEGRFVDGWIYSPRHGSEFNAQLTLLDPNKLDLHGYVLFPLLGQSQVWERVSNPPACASRQFAGPATQISQK